MVHGLGKQVLAEGVETKEQFATLESCGCDGVQGFLLGEPMSADAFTRRLEATGRDLSYTARARFAHG
jgi:EAL domain-containing protein (putative c-di-GMP-specific phosphodiesterase class I)